MATANKNLSNYDKSTLPKAVDFKIGMVVSEWNIEITQDLAKGASETLLSCGVKESNIFVEYVPGSFELVFAAKKAQSKDLDAIIAIGCIIQGQTKHFDFVCQGVTQGIKDLNVLYNTPVIFCVLTDETLQQSIDRSGGKYGNKGTEAAVTAVKMAALSKTQ